MMLSAPTDQMAFTAFTVSSAKWMAVTVGFLLLAGALLAQVMERWKKSPRARSAGGGDGRSSACDAKAKGGKRTSQKLVLDP
jgi:hypothetical protein